MWRKLISNPGSELGDRKGNMEETHGAGLLWSDNTSNHAFVKQREGPGIQSVPLG